MWNIDKAYIDGKFVPVHGDEVIETTNPSTEQVIGTATLANRDDARGAIAAAQRAQQTLARTSKAERIDMLMRLQTAVLASTERIRDATIDEYGGPVARAQWVSEYASQCFANTAKALDDYPLTRRVGDATVFMAPVGVAGLIAPWNSTAGTICSKLASAIAAGCASVIKPSELSPIQTMVVAEALHDAGLPPGVFNILLGRGADVGDEISTNPGVAKISFTGSTPTGDLSSAIPLALNAAFMNNGQACVAGTRLLVPRSRLDEVIEQVKAAVATMRVGDPRDPSTVVGPLVNRAQYDRVQHFIRRGIEQGALLVTGGEGRPAGLDKGYFVNPTVFAGVRNDMDIAREEIFGPVLSILEYENEDDAIRIANDSVYGLQAYVFSSQTGRAERVASQLEAGTVLINRIKPELLAPFGGLKQSGLGREFGVFGLEAFLEPKSIVSA